MSNLRLFSANEFSPGIVDLGDVLSTAIQYAGDRVGFVEELRKRYFHDHAQKQSTKEKQLEQQLKLANNVRIGLSNYGLYDAETSSLTPVGLALAELKGAKIHKEFSAYILKELHGLEILDVLEGMQKRRERVTKITLAKSLSDAGFTTYKGGVIPLNTTDHTKLIAWLRESGVISLGGYEINKDVLATVVGFTSDELKEIQGLSREQRAFIETFWGVAVSQPQGEFFTKDILEICRNNYGTLLDSVADQFAVKVFSPLETLGFIERSDPGKGRGGKSGKVKPTDKLLSLKPDIFQIRSMSDLPTDLRNQLNMPMEKVWENLSSVDTYEKGIALEVLAYRIASCLGLSLSKFRLRGPRSTNGAEVDLVCDGMSLLYSRWVVQCKNTPKSSVPLDVLAKEVGMAYMLKAHVVLLITTGVFAETVRRHADGIAESSHLQIVLVDEAVLSGYKEHGISFLLSHFRSTAQRALEIKKIQVFDE